MLTPEIKMRGAIASAVSLVCSDGNSDVKRVVDDVITCLAHAGFVIIPKPIHAHHRATSRGADGETQIVGLRYAQEEFQAVMAAVS